MWVAIMILIGCGGLSVWGMKDIWNSDYDGMQPDW
jgi:hypothetical protein